MRLNVNSPLETLKILEDFKNKKTVLNAFSHEENALNFLENNRNNYRNPRKLDVVLSNFQNNCLFSLSDNLKKDMFAFMENSQCIRIVDENERYKIYLYFCGTIESGRIKELLMRYSEDKYKKIDFKDYISKNLNKLFTKKEFPQYLNGNYEALKELIPLIAEDHTAFEKLQSWQDNLLGYLYESDIDPKFLEEVNISIVQGLSRKIYDFLRRNNSIKVKKVSISFKELNGTKYKVYTFTLSNRDYLLVYGQFKQDTNRVKQIFNFEDIRFFYSKKSSELTLKMLNMGAKVNRIELVRAFKPKYKLNKKYMVGYYLCCAKEFIVKVITEIVKSMSKK